jgi:hypothetical protein
VVHHDALRYALARLVNVPVQHLPFSGAATADIAADVLLVLAHSPGASIEWHDGHVTEV